MIVRHYVLATAGHIDHGKSALVKALTGTDPDRLPEEKRRGITIDLGFAGLSMTANDGSTIHAGIVDVPGHEGFVRNMIAGVGSVDLALFVVAADDGWMPQTEEHLQILTYLGVRRAVVAITKADLGGADETSLQTRQKLDGTPFATAPLVIVSARNATGLGELKGTLATELSRCTTSRDIGKPRLFVDRAFSLSGIGTIVTGTLSGGQFRREKQVILELGNQRTRIRSMQNHGSAIEVATPGMRAAINLPGLTISSSSKDVRRGDVLTNQAFEPSRTLDVMLERSERALKPDRREPPLATGSLVYVHHGTSRTQAKLVLLESAALGPGEQKIAQLRLATPVVAFHGDRFVIRDSSERRTLAGGIVLDPAANRKTFRGTAQRRLLIERAAAPDDIGVAIKTELERHGAAHAPTLLHQSRFSAEDIAADLKTLQNAGSVVIRGDIVADVTSWQSLVKRAGELIDKAHRASADKAGMELDKLRSALNQPPAVFDAVIAELSDSQFVRTGNLLARKTHRAELPHHLRPIADWIRSKLSATPFDPPSRKELATDRDGQQTIAFMIREGEIVEAGADLLLSQKAFNDMTSAIGAFIRSNGAATVSQIRQALHTSRRVAVPLLEKLDRDGFTRREGDRRRLARN